MLRPPVSMSWPPALGLLAWLLALLGLSAGGAAYPALPRHRRGRRPRLRRRGALDDFLPIAVSALPASDLAAVEPGVPRCASTLLLLLVTTTCCGRSGRSSSTSPTPVPPPARPIAAPVPARRDAQHRGSSWRRLVLLADLGDRRHQPRRRQDARCAAAARGGRRGRDPAGGRSGLARAAGLDRPAPGRSRTTAVDPDRGAARRARLRTLLPIARNVLVSSSC